MDMIFDVVMFIVVISEVIMLELGDVIVMGIFVGIGYMCKLLIYLIFGDVCEVEIEYIGLLCNEVVDEFGVIVQEVVV